MIACNRTWAERYVTSERNISIKTLQHVCELPLGHDSDRATRKTPCQCRCTPRAEFRWREGEQA